MSARLGILTLPRLKLSICVSLGTRQVTLGVKRLYVSHIHPLDCHDNGIMATKIPRACNYNVGASSLGARISRMNLKAQDVGKDALQMCQFMKAMHVADTELREALSAMEEQFVNYKALYQAVQDRFKYHASGRVVYLEQSIDHRGMIHELERELNIPDEQKLLYVVSKKTKTETSGATGMQSH